MANVLFKPVDISIGDNAHEYAEKISNESHEDEWIRISKMYLDLAEDESINDIYYYRHRCIEGLLTGHTNDYGRI